MEQSHVAAENIREHQRILGMKFYVTLLKLLCSLLGWFDEMVGLGWTHRLHGMSLLTVAVSYFLLPDSRCVSDPFCCSCSTHQNLVELLQDGAENLCSLRCDCHH